MVLQAQSLHLTHRASATILHLLQLDNPEHNNDHDLYSTPDTVGLPCSITSSVSMDDTKLRALERQYKLRVKTGCGTCR